jgi:arylsulfatase A-like enzyme
LKKKRKPVPPAKGSSRPMIAPAVAVLLLAVILILLLRPGGDGDAPAPAGFVSRPNVLLLGIDTLREDHTCSFEHSGVRTPYMEALARDGIRFARCISTAPWTLPSFASIFTGHLPSHHEAIGGGYQRLDDRHTTVAERFSDAGYHTVGFMGVYYLTSAYNMEQGYNTDMHVPKVMTDYDQASTVTALSLEYCKRYGHEPFYLFTHYFDPHAPYAPPPPYDTIYYFDRDPRAPGEPILDTIMASVTLIDDNKETGMYDWLDGITDWQYPTAQYAAEVSYTDEQVGRLMAGLKEQGLYDDMLIVLVADHGEHLIDHGIYFTHYLPYQETIHVPLIVKLPGNRGAGRVVQEPVSTLDVLPTILEVAGLEVPGDLPGRSLLAPMLGEAEIGPRTLLAEQGSANDRFTKALVEWPWKLIYFREGESERVELYRLDQDPWERTDLSGQAPSVAKALTDRLWTFFDPDTPLIRSDQERPAELDEAARQRLRSLGYVD